MPPQMTVPPFLVAERAAGTSAPTGAKISAASSGSGGAAVEIPGPLGAEAARELLRREVARAGEREHEPALMAGDLGDDVRGGAKPVDADRVRLAGHAQAAVADQPGAHQRRRFDIAVAGVDRKAIALIGHAQLGIAAVDRVAGETRAIAKIFAAAAAIVANPAGPAEPRHPDPVAERETVDLRPLVDDDADDLVTKHQRQLRVGELTIDDMQVGAAHGAGAHRDQHLLRPGTRRRQFRRDQGLSRCRQQFRSHRRAPATPSLV